MASKWDNTQLFCFDVDKTITNSHMHGYLSGVAGYAELSDQEKLDLINRKLDEKGIKNKQMLCDTIRQALANGHKVAITSFCKFPEMIEPILVRIGLTDDERLQIIRVLGYPSDKGEPTMQGGSPKHIDRKNQHIKVAKELAGVNHNPNVHLIDDDIINCDCAKSEGYRVHKVPADGEKTYLAELHDYVRVPILTKRQALNKQLSVNAVINALKSGHRTNKYWNENSDGASNISTDRQYLEFVFKNIDAFEQKEIKFLLEGGSKNQRAKNPPAAITKEMLSAYLAEQGVQVNYAFSVYSLFNDAYQAYVKVNQDQLAPPYFDLRDSILPPTPDEVSNASAKLDGQSTNLSPKSSVGFAKFKFAHSDTREEFVPQSQNVPRDLALLTNILENERKLPFADVHSDHPAVKLGLTVLAVSDLSNMNSNIGRRLYSNARKVLGLPRQMPTSIGTRNELIKDQQSKAIDEIVKRGMLNCATDYICAAFIASLPRGLLKEKLSTYNDDELQYLAKLYKKIEQEPDAFSGFEYQLGIYSSTVQRLRPPLSHMTHGECMKSFAKIAATNGRLAAAVDNLPGTKRAGLSHDQEGPSKKRRFE